MIIELPLRKVPSQDFDIVLNGQTCTIELMRRVDKVFCSLKVDGEYIWRGHIVHDRTPIRQFLVQKFVGNLVFIDHNGTEQPDYRDFGGRWRFYYITDDVTMDAETFQRRGTED